LASFYGTPAVRPLFMVMSLSFVITAAGATQSALLVRAMDFRGLELRLTGGAVVGSGVAIAVARLGGGPWALIAQQVTVSLVSTVLVWRFSTWRPSFTFSGTSLRELGSFSGRVCGTRLLFYANRNADNVLVGRFLGAGALGIYAIAYNVMLLPTTQIAAPVQEVLYPAFSRFRDDTPRIAAAWLAVNRMVAALTLPALAGIAVAAPDLVSVVLGAKWHSAARVIQILAWVGMLQSLQGLNSSILQARDRTQLLIRYAVVVCTASLTAFAVGLHWGLLGVAVAYAVSSTIVEPYYTSLTARSLGLTLLDVGRSLSGVIQATIGMAVVVLLARTALVGSGLAPLPRLLCLVVLGGCVYATLVIWRAPEIGVAVRGLRARAAVAPAAEAQLS
jgi:O-antigen/teichoic acid export membrane protein